MPRRTQLDGASPVSFPVNVARLPQKGLPLRFEANADQRKELAEVHGLESVETFVAELLVVGWKRHGVRISGRVVADIVQSCVVTLEPIESRIDEEVEAVFLPQDSKLGRQGFETGGEIVLDAEGDDAPETFSGDHIDVGAVSEEFFGLAIDPYPRKAGADLMAAAPEARDDTDDSAAGWKARLSGLATRK